MMFDGTEEPESYDGPTYREPAPKQEDGLLGKWRATNAAIAAKWHSTWYSIPEYLRVPIYIAANVAALYIVTVFWP